MKIWTVNSNLEDKTTGLNDNEARVINLEDKSIVYGSFILTKGRNFYTLENQRLIFCSQICTYFFEILTIFSVLKGEKDTKLIKFNLLILKMISFRFYA